MNDVKHTPGPWEQSHRKVDGGMYSTQVYTPDGETIATLHWYPKPKDERGVIGTYREANARLIAAAPELLEALEGLAEAALDTTRPFYPQPHHKSLGMAIEQARAAIAKARGE